MERALVRLIGLNKENNNFKRRTWNWKGEVTIVCRGELRWVMRVDMIKIQRYTVYIYINSKE